MKKYGEFYVTIGLEIHVALQTKQKLFSATENSFEVDQFSLLDIGMPGVLPVLSKEPVEMASAFALSVGASLERYSEFERKHYFYPDLPLGYQITQQHKPILIGGLVPIKLEGETKLIEIEHAHLECDAAKSIHDKYHDYTAIDISRCASPLLEIVSTPCMHSPEEAKEYAKTVHSLVTFLGICDGKMEEGSFRVDASISLCKEIGKLGTRVEIKNISSFGFLQTAMEYEIQRQTDLILSGQKVVMETRLFDEVSSSTKSMREKETVDEYRYMPDPDILPLYLEDELIETVKSSYFTDYFKAKEKLFALFQSYTIDIEEAVLVQLLKTHREICAKIIEEKSVSEKLLRLLAFWLPEVLGKVEVSKTYTLSDLLILEKSPLQAKEVKETLTIWLTTDKSLEDCMPKFMDSSEVESSIKSIVEKYPEQIQKFKSGETKILQFLVGKVMAEMKGKVPAALVKQTVEKIIQ